VLDDKVNVLEHSVKDKEKNEEEQNMQDLWDTIKTSNS
jgi:hypothetical protein